uniref:Uncharacterized protein n=1 Tax=Oryza glumipatula TaxID=40148 RepID=A0A0D9YP81_9ORYZ
MGLDIWKMEVELILMAQTEDRCVRENIG